MKKLIAIWALSIQSVYGQQYAAKIQTDINEALDSFRVVNNLIPLARHKDLDSAASYFLKEHLSGRKISHENLSDQFNINVFQINFYGIRYLGNGFWMNTQLLEILQLESFYLLNAKDSFVTVAVGYNYNANAEYVAIVCYGSKTAHCHLPARN